MAVATKKKTYTVDDLWEMSHSTGKRLELVKGELRELPPTSSEHGYVELNLGAILREFVRQHSLGKVVTGEAGFVLEEGKNATVRGADVAFIRAEKLPEGKLPNHFARFAPDLVAEVLSPSDTFPNVLDKVNDWLEAGVALVWVVDPQGKRVYIYRKEQPVRVVGDDEMLSGEDVLPGFECRVSEIFE
ncbi:MAG: Uma2 family endonuclease [Armatimonadota bacterium]